MEEKYPVEVYLYDLGQGLAKLGGNPAFGQSLEGVWHSGLVAYGREYFFTQEGIACVVPGSTGLGEPDRIENLGDTQLPYSVFLDYLLTIGENKFKAGSWDLVNLNSNSFSDELSQFICGQGLPKYILELPPDMRTTPEICTQMGRISAPQFSGISLGLISESRTGRARREESPEFEQLQAQIDALRADQLSLEQRRNAINAKEEKETKKEKTKKTKEEKEQKRRRKEEKKARRKSSEEGIVSPPAFLNKPETGRLSPSSSSSDMKEGAPVITKSSLRPPTSPPSTSNSSPASILKEERALERHKSLKRVSFEEQPDIIDDSRESTVEVAVVGDLEEEDIPALEEVDRQNLGGGSDSDPALVRPQTPPGERMSSAQENGRGDVGGVTTHVEGEPGEASGLPSSERKPHEKGIVFRDFDQVQDFEDLVRAVVGLCTADEQERLREMEEWIVKGDGTWVLAEGFNSFLGKVLHCPDWPREGRVAMLKLLAFGAEQDDIVLILHMDRRDHLVMNYAQQFDRLSIEEQEELARLWCNLFETGSASEWTLYISEWTPAPGAGGLPLSNIRITTKVAVNALLGETSQLVEYGTALMANLATKEVKAVVFDDVCSELAMAILQFFQGKPSEEHVFRCMGALSRFCSINREVPQLVKMIGPDPSKFSGLSPRVDQQLAPLAARLANIPMF